MDFLFSASRFCPLCTKSTSRQSWLCWGCMERFCRLLHPKFRWIDSRIQLIYLVDWWPDDRAMTLIVHSLKGGGLPSVFADLATEFADRSPKKGLIYYPKGRKSYDHGYLWASSLARLNSGTVSPLLKSSPGKQALLSRSKRVQLSFMPVGPQPLKTAQFADDVVTTGATCRAAWRALGRPEKMTAWSLFYRQTLR